MCASSTARLVLTGEGGGSWTVPCGPDEIVHLSDVPALPDVTVTADVVEWCLMVGERVDARPPRLSGGRSRTRRCPDRRRARVRNRLNRER